jgi:hypothetical protein
MPKKPAENPKIKASFLEIAHNSLQLTTNPYKNGYFPTEPTKTRKSPTTAHKGPGKPEKKGESANNFPPLFAFAMLLSNQQFAPAALARRDLGPVLRSQSPYLYFL